MRSSTTLFLLWLQLGATVLGSHPCMHDTVMERFMASVDTDTLTSDQSIASDSGRRLSSEGSPSLFNPIRISFDISKLSSDPGYMCVNVGDTVTRDGSAYTCSQNDLLTSDKRSFILNVLLPAITTYFTKVLSVQSVSGNLVVPGIGCKSTGEWACCTNSIPPYLATTGIANTDFLIHVTARPTSGAVLAWALPCNLDQFGRPISGQANFGPNRLDSSSGARTQQVGTALHEMTHALGFSASRFGDFRQPLNGPAWGAGNVVRNTQERGVAVSKIVTPKVVAAVKQQFNCYNWVNAGGELENGAQGKAATTTSHWEKRVFHNEYMTATASANPVYSALTLALFEDSGWYTANYSMAQVCCQAKCSEWSGDYFCTQKGDHCSPTRDAKGYCSITTYTSSIPAGFQYFSNAALGGQDTYSDYCPLYNGYSNGGCYNPATYTTAGMGEVLSSSSQCFQSTLSTSRARSTSTPACYAVNRCTKTAMIVTVGTTQVSCPMAGGNIAVPGYAGTLTCPPANVICQLLQNECSGAGALQTDGTCLCNPGFNGADCSLLDCPATNGVTCNGHGTCDGTTGACTCSAGYTGLACAVLVCPGVKDFKYNDAQCSGHGTCNGALGTCTCDTGYSGNACQCIPGCPGCSGHGSCDCLTGSCVCDAGYYGPSCLTTTLPATTLLQLDSKTPYTGTITAKNYQFFKVLLNSSSTDVTVVLTSTTGDADIYASFGDPYPSVGSLRASTFISDANRTDGVDAVTLCGSLGDFPRGINDTFRFCAAPNAQFVQGAPGYFYIGVFGFASTTFTLTVELDKCTKEACSGHGTCGKYYGGVCACDRFWTGDACNLPQCRPDCVDYNDCSVPGSSTPKGGRATGLRNTTDCYGNGVCTVVTTNGVAQPTCVCDPAYTYANPTDAQSLCKVPIPSIAYVHNFNSSFVVFAETVDQQVGIGLWALYTVVVQPNWSYLYIELDASSAASDALLLVRKNTLPSLDVTRPYPVQAANAGAWAARADRQRVLLTRAASTLSDGLLYIGVYNTDYARAPLAYGLTVQANASCVNASNVCAATATCSVQLATMCACDAGFSGTFCDLGPIPHRRLWLNQSATNLSVVLAPGDWTYVTFDVPDPDVAYVRVVLAGIDDALPVMLVREPLETGLPALQLPATYDFDGMVAGRDVQSVLVPVTTACTGSTCFKVAVHNKAFAADVLQASLTLTPVAASTPVFAVTSCASAGAGDLENCGGRGTCIETATGPQCLCKNGWHGLRCESPSAIDMATLWYATANISMLCSVCNETFALPNAAAKLFMVPQSMQPGTGLELRVSSLDDSSGASPNVFVAEVPPRSIYDFSLLSFTNGTDEVVQLVNEPLSGHFWVLVYSHMPISVTSNDTTAQFAIAASVIAANGTSAAPVSVTDSGFLPSVVQWLTTTPLGIVVLTLLSIFLTLIVGFFVYRIFRAPDNQDGAMRTIANGMPVGHRQAPVPSPAIDDDSPRNSEEGRGGHSIDIELTAHPNITQFFCVVTMELYASLAEGAGPKKKEYWDRQTYASLEEQQDAMKQSSTLYVGNLSFFTSETQIYELFSVVGPVRAVIMGLDRIKKTPCGFCFVEYFNKDHAQACANFISGTKLDQRVIRCELDGGFREGRQFGRGTTGGQVRDDRRSKDDYDPGRGGYGKKVDDFGHHTNHFRRAGGQKRERTDSAGDFDGRPARRQANSTADNADMDDSEKKEENPRFRERDSDPEDDDEAEDAPMDDDAA
ncbi:leishmanolysin-like peptidase [Achlya hypogyna]|uniref:Nuclear cap-binding protein subunit 2 n=1 Tax=Achlya hypogyna TaxID=1202772 RepID=A0A1V9Z9M9_ACHHY|nr:leishmanolysin-like peptidase [Achlya hypogyna]